MRNFFKKFLPIILAIWPYLCFVLFSIYSYVDEENKRILYILFYCYVLLTVVVYVSNIIHCCLYRGEDSAYQLAFWNMLIKLIHIPFYVTVLLQATSFLFIMVIPPFLLMATFMFFIFFVVCLLLMLTSSFYGINALIRARQAKDISIVFTVVNIVLHVFFLTDLISSILLFINLKKQRSTKTTPFQTENSI